MDEYSTMSEKEEKELENKVIKKITERLRKIRANMNVNYDYTTYDTNAVLTEVGHEIRGEKIRRERNAPITTRQLTAINNMRQQVDETIVSKSDFNSSAEVDKEFQRLKKKIREYKE